MSATHYGCKYKQILFTMQTIGNRIREIKNFYFGTDRGSDKKFADSLHVTKQTAANWFGRGNGIGEKVINQILTAFPDIDRGWLVGGNGSMFISENKKASINIGNISKPAGMPNIVNIPEHLEAPKIKSINLVEGFSEKLVKLGYEKPVDEKGYKVIALDLADRLNRMASMSEDMVGIVSKPLLDRIGLVDKQRILAESRVAELEAKIAAMEIKAAK